MRKSFVLYGILIALIAVVILIVALAVDIKNDHDHSLHTLDREVKVIDYLSGDEGHIDIRVDGTGALIIKELNAKTATVHAVGTTDIMVIIKETSAEVSVDARDSIGFRFVLEAKPDHSEGLLANFVQSQCRRTYEGKRSIPKKEGFRANYYLKGGVHTIEHLRLNDHLAVRGYGVLIVENITTAPDISPEIKVGDNVLVVVLKGDVNIDASGVENGGAIINSSSIEQDAMIAAHLTSQYPGYYEGRKALEPSE